MQSWLANFDRASKLLLHVHSEVQIYGILYALNSFKGDLLTFLKTWHQLENNIFKHLIRPTGTNGAKRHKWCEKKSRNLFCCLRREGEKVK